MEEQSNIQIPRAKLGSQGLEVSKLGFGCMGLTGIYNTPVSEEAGISIIKDAFSKGITFFNTADIYGPHTNEILLGKALKQLPREKIELATKCGIVGYGKTQMIVKGTPEYSIPIKETMAEFKKLVEEGKVKYIGLSEARPDTIRRAHAVHSITALQMEWSLTPFGRVILKKILSHFADIVRWLLLAVDFFGGKAIVESIPANSFLVSHPRFVGDNLEKNKILYTRLVDLAVKHHCTPAQLALAWVLHQGHEVVPIPGQPRSRTLTIISLP
ncbi:hypothetical protein J5N97_000846 [Dioscorea zingiberensis]|uniref:NADP-dependent oxidoreductase domain-containing protein n=1 Tax=Dioscorea zingiberensis TaxID=325984 RepID=A0A9D5BUP8_9LILI|nr:hypothetical protein J5N97_000846 [Dioscorea zingiberensis]